MKYLFSLLLLLILSCHKENNNSPSSSRNIKFEVTLSNGLWNGQYTDANGSSQASNFLSAWTYSYTAKSEAPNIYIAVIPIESNVTVNIKLYLNNALVKTSTITTDQHTVSSYILYTF